MEPIFNMMAGWNPFGQGLFLLIIFCLVIVLIRQLAYFGLVLFRGWPPVGTPSLTTLTGEKEDK